MRSQKKPSQIFVAATISKNSRFSAPSYAIHCDEHLWTNFPDTPYHQIRKSISDFIEVNGYPFGFQQGLDLKTFNAYTIILENVNNFLKKIDPLFVDIPLSFRDWEDRVKMAILTYAAYYEAFFGPGRQFVGGGADTVTLHWPQE